jgi:glycosyltransferase involved in cell wall biosynthesis
MDVLEVVEDLSVPTVVVLHTVLTHPTAGQREVLLRLLAAADVVVTMTETARDRLVRRYDALPEQVVVIPHGAVEHRPARRVPRPRQRPLVLTWGLLGPGKGIEWAVDALPELRDLDPRYLVVGRTHPKVFERDGDAYRDGLLARAQRLGVADLLELDASYLSVSDLVGLVGQADVVLLPYDSVDQVTSGVLTEAVAAGRPVVSTSFPHARELLPGGPGLVVPQGDGPAIAAAVRRVLTEPGLAGAMAAASARCAPELYWGAVAGRYRALADGLVAAALAEVS